MYVVRRNLSRVTDFANSFLITYVRTIVCISNTGFNTLLVWPQVVFKYCKLFVFYALPLNCLFYMYMHVFYAWILCISGISI